MAESSPVIFSANDPGPILEAIPGPAPRMLLFGAPGSGRATLAAGLAEAMIKQGLAPYCLDADIGGPAFGVPGAVCLGRWQGRRWKTEAIEGLCSLNAGRFRLPLVRAVRRLTGDSVKGALIILPPAITRGIAGAELLPALVESAGIRAIVTLGFDDDSLPYPDEMAASGAVILRVGAARSADRLSRKLRTDRRTDLWNSYLAGGNRMVLNTERIPVTGTPPPMDAPEAWQGRQAALMRNGRTLAMGEVAHLDGQELLLRVPGAPDGAERIVIRDAGRLRNGSLATLEAAVPKYEPKIPQRSRGGDVMPVTMGGLTASLMNGVCGDPLLHLRLMNLKQSLLFDLGGGSRLPTRLAHQVSDVFISHAHMDHIAGFIWLMRSRIGAFPPCRIYGPPGLAAHIRGMMDGVLWDRAGELAPRFLVHEIHGPAMRTYRLEAGTREKRPTDETGLEGQLILKTKTFRISAATLDHGTPVLTFKFDLTPELTRRRLVYATDLADTLDNRERLIRFARNADILICEAAFIQAHRQKAASSGHLTARACGEIARAAGVKQLIPFHFSKRYAARTEQVYGEVEKSLAGSPITCASSSPPPG